MLVMGAAGCQRSYDEPEPYKVWTEQDVENDGYEVMSIVKFKDKYFYQKYPFGGRDPETGVTYHGGLPLSTVISDKVAISGKVISTDQPGNLYRSLYIQDGTGAIEIKVGATGLYNDYKIGQTLYIKADGLVLGNYRYMLSLGSESAESNYANGYIDRQAEINRTVLRGKIEPFTAADTIVVTAENIATKLRDPQDLGRIVRFEKIESRWDEWDSATYPLFARTSPSYQEWNFKEVVEEWNEYKKGNGPKPTSPEPGKCVNAIDGGDPYHVTWAFKGLGHSYYGSALFGYGTTNFIVRSSGYSIFALVKLPEDGALVDMTAMYTKYSSGSGGFIKYQLLLNSSNDVVKPGTNKPFYFYDRNENIW